MKLLLDMGLAPRTAAFLNQLGHDASHLGNRGQARLGDADVILEAEAEGRIVVTFDLDYARIIALQRMARPSVILFRLERFTTDEVNATLASLLSVYEPQLQTGAILGVDSHRVRLRMLPIW